MKTVLSFICMLRHYNVHCHIYLSAEALQRGQFSHLLVCRGITMWRVLTFIYMLRYYNVDSSHIYQYAEALQCREYSHLSVYKATMKTALKIVMH